MRHINMLSVCQRLLLCRSRWQTESIIMDGQLVEADVKLLNFSSGLHTAWHRAIDKEGRREIVSSLTLLGVCQWQWSMTMTISMTSTF